MNLSYSTVHGSKGLEADYVVIINADDSRLGFPNKMEDDVLLNMVLSSKSNYEFAEERRLWYVALTRTKNYTYILANNENPSIFVKEISDKCLVMNPDMELNHNGEIKCPHCKSGRLVERRNESDGTKFFGCSNYPYCDYTIDDFMAVTRNKRCPRCGDFMIYKKGPYGAFYGCHNYPRCKHKEEYIPSKRK
jgi:DNA helicase-4